MNYPQDLKYTENDEWIRADGDQAKIGISDFAQDQLSDVVYLEYTVEIGDTVSAGDAVGTVESVKAAADVYAPVSGEVTSLNEALLNSPELINSDPYGEAWMIEMTLRDESELGRLMSAEEYQAFNENR